MLHKRTLTLIVLALFGLTIALVPTLAQDYNQSPVLDEQVESGELPAVADRLPVEPMVVEPLESIGEYGGTWNFGLSGGGENFFLFRTIGHEPLLRWTPEWDSWTYNIAQDLIISDDSTEFTFVLREGMKWSDGEPFTADDIMFWYEDVASNEEINPTFPNTFTTGGEPVVVEKVDDYTVVFKFAEPYGFFPLRMAMGDGTAPVQYPRHYLEQFHASYSENVDAEAEDAGFASWSDYFLAQAENWSNVDKPNLYAWKLQQPYPGGDSVIVAERNPYYWKVDPEGNQLPYMDRVQMFVAEETEALVLRGLNGDIDMQDRHIGSLDNKPIFFDSQENGDYRLFNTVSSWGNAFCIYPNLSIPDPVINEIFNNRDFRAGLSHAINRQEIIDLVYLGQGMPSQFAPHLDGPFANEQMSFQFTEYDLDKANELLDNVLPEKDEQGFRLRPDGERLLITTNVASGFAPELIDGMEIVRQYWAEVGVDLNVQVVDRSIQWERKAANELEIFVWPGGGGGGLDVLLNVQAYFPDRGAAFQAPAWGDWYASNGADGIEPPENVRTMMEMYRELVQIADPDAQIELMNEIVQISADWFPQICITTAPDLFGIVKNDMRNVPDSMIHSATYPNPGPTNPETYFFVGGEG
jgi:peptide/nickel transport system substrate-binding protein